MIKLDAFDSQDTDDKNIQNYLTIVDTINKNSDILIVIFFLILIRKIK
jgi:hypothetical protein